MPSASYLRKYFNFIQLGAPRTTGWKADTATRYVQDKRRGTFDPLEPTQEPRWFAVLNVHWAVIESRRLKSGTILKRVFIAPTLDWIDGGWHIAEFGSRTGVFVCTKGDERRMIEISPNDLSLPRP